MRAIHGRWEGIAGSWTILSKRLRMPGEPWNSPATRSMSMYGLSPCDTQACLRDLRKVVVCCSGATTHACMDKRAVGQDRTRDSQKAIHMRAPKRTKNNIGLASILVYRATATASI